MHTIDVRECACSIRQDLQLGDDAAFPGRNPIELATESIDLPVGSFVKLRHPYIGDIQCKLVKQYDKRTIWLEVGAAAQ
jgi:hypothetical protein